jgi:hypothetical protein
MTELGYTATKGISKEIPKNAKVEALGRLSKPAYYYSRIFARLAQFPKKTHRGGAEDAE